MTAPPSHPAIQFSGEDRSNSVRRTIASMEPVSLRTPTPSQAVLAKSSGIFHWTPEGRRLYDFSSGVLVANLGHNPRRWLQRLGRYLGWSPEFFAGDLSTDTDITEQEFATAVSLTAYNAITEVEAEATRRLLQNLQASTGGARCETVMWAASGSEAVQKALWACLKRDPSRSIILATRHGFHGKKGLAGSVTGCETDADRDPRVKFISFPKAECSDIDSPDQPFDPQPYEAELQAMWDAHGSQIACLITEPYLGGGGSYHPPKQYLQLLERFCRRHDILFVLDEVQSNFGRTGKMYAFESYGVEPDFVCLGKGLGNGIPVSAAVGRSDVCGRLKYGEASDTWSANPLSCASVLATLDEFEQSNVLEHTLELSSVFTSGLLALKETGVVVRVRGEGMVFGIECGPVGRLSPAEVAMAVVRRCYVGDETGTGIHLLGPLAGCVLRVSPPMSMALDEATVSLQLLRKMIADVAALPDGELET